MKILVTGAAGFIGFHTCLKLINQGHQVYGIDNINDYYYPKLKFDRLKELLSILKATFKVECIENVNLFTIRHFNETSSKEILKNNELLLEQRTNEVLQLIVR